MAGSQTIYRKIQVVLDYAKEGIHNDKMSLLKYIAKRSPTNFIYSYRDRKTDEIVSHTSIKSIEQVIDLCSELNFISDKDFQLTEVGMSATDPTRFPVILGRNVTKLLNKKGVTINAILESISNILVVSNPKPPTSDEIWARLNYSEGKINFNTFKRLIDLLGQCKVLSMTQRRIFLPYFKSPK